MPKSCNYEGCRFSQFGGGYCKYHQGYRTDKKPRGLKKISKNGRQGLKKKKTVQEKDWKFYLEIWAERPHLDFETNEPIFGEALTLYFHHILEKRNYPRFRYCKWNVVIVNWDTHQKAENNIDLVPKIKNYKNKLLKTKL